MPDPHPSDELCRQGNRLLAAGDLNGAIRAYNQALNLRPDYAEVMANLCNTLALAGRADEAVLVGRKAVQIRPNLAIGWNNLGRALVDAQKPAEAITALQEAVRLRPDLPESAYNLANALCATGKIEQSLPWYHKALSLRAAFAEASSNLATALADLGQIELGSQAFEDGLAKSPMHAGLHSGHVYTAHFDPKFDRAQLLSQGRRWNDRHANFPRASHTNDRSPDRRLRIGYVSPDFRFHAESFFTLPLLSAHDHKNFEIFCYSDVIRPDSVTDKLKKTADHWRNTVGISDDQLAQTIRADGIDILVDLTMHMERNRLLAFARKPAPIQVAWLAYPGGTGLAAIDYRLTDSRIDPPGETDQFFAEKSIRLPDCWICYDPMSDLPPVQNRPPGPIRFGSLNHPRKHNRGTIELWMRVLKEVPDSQLIILANDKSAILQMAEGHGIAPERIEFIARLPRNDYLETYRRIDIALDPLPYNGITTSLDSLWMGVPVLTLVGQTGPGRFGLSLLSMLGLTDWIAQTESEFIRLAKEFSSRQDFRKDLRARMQNSPVMDSSRFARNVESAYRKMWNDWLTAAVTS
jgi:protein O-GlcNAc transferase